MSENHEHWMRQAIALAQQAANNNEVPVGAILVLDNQVIGEGQNQPIESQDATAHAEIVAIRAACAELHNYRIPGSTLYVTIEPCTMCVGAMIHARIESVVFGAREPKAGALVSNLQLQNKPFFNHQLNYVEGVLATDCSKLMTEFFREKRSNS
jgi:tRNA(adenine34) deaminase